jgi:hypothetical protein
LLLYVLLNVIKECILLVFELLDFLKHVCLLFYTLELKLFELCLKVLNRLRGIGLVSDLYPGFSRCTLRKLFFQRLNLLIHLFVALLGVGQILLLDGQLPLEFDHILGLGSLREGF